MAAATVLPAMPAPIKQSRKVYQPEPFDARVLSAKLEQLQPMDSSKRSKRASYVPQNAAKHFTATTTVKDKAGDDLKRAASTRERRKPSFTADGKPSINPKQLRAALIMGMTEDEAANAVPDIPERRSSGSSVSGNEKSRRRSKHASSQPTMPDSDVRLEQDEPMRGYRPGDAAKRNTEKRISQIVPPQGKVTVVQHGSRTTYERSYDLNFGARIHDPELGHGHHGHHDSAIVEDDVHDEPMHTYRPKLKPHDRVDWAQASQAGEDMHRLLHAPWRRRKSSKTSGDRDEAMQALQGTSKGNSSTSRRPGMAARHMSKSLNNIHEHVEQPTLVSDAVTKIKKEEKAKRRQSIVHFFKRS